MMIDMLTPRRLLSVLIMKLCGVVEMSHLAEAGLANFIVRAEHIFHFSGMALFSY